jgi:ubiquinol-cytochrome c reductase iron-sulfur subunit
MSIARQMDCGPGFTRRRFLYAAAATVGVAGAAAAAWPLFDQMNPDARVRAAREIASVDGSALRPAEQHLVHWHNLPIVVVRRTQAMLDAMRAPAFVAELIDPDSEKHQQPAYARNWHRSVDSAFAVLVAVCTECRCVPTYYADASVLNAAGGYQCPCCASHYDPAGRAYAGIAPYNLPVPPHAIDGKLRISVGLNQTDDPFSLDSIERI